MALALLEHEVERELARELDEPVVLRFRDDEDVLDVGVDPGAAWTGVDQPFIFFCKRVRVRCTELLAHLPDADGGLGQLPGQAAAILLAVRVVFVLWGRRGVSVRRVSVQRHPGGRLLVVVMGRMRVRVEALRDADGVVGGMRRPVRSAVALLRLEPVGERGALVEVRVDEAGRLERGEVVRFGGALRAGADADVLRRIGWVDADVAGDRVGDRTCVGVQRLGRRRALRRARAGRGLLEDDVRVPLAARRAGDAEARRSAALAGQGRLEDGVRGRVGRRRHRGRVEALGGGGEERSGHGHDGGWVD
jgi:hypothetical protein